jgi:hypothetical protein
MLKQDSAVHAQGGAGNVISVIRGEEGSGFANVLGCAKATPGKARAGLAHQLIAESFVLTRCINPAWLDNVDVDSVWAKLTRNRKGHLVQSRFTGVVGQAPGIGNMNMAARDENNLTSVATFNHVPRDKLTHVKSTGQCSFNYGGKAFGIELEEIGTSLQRRVTYKYIDTS